ncbi:glutamate-5-semialdehyde dehydrogenase [Hyphomicrobium sp.]|uniref:glutamate-5-semialdehyde dehydrogenase n=1 Tax=Hyphomicrobium sp. TaxID=82 RepID=UPI000FC3017F|nr:glutamate-5-semialdehyde dehydrogenase [Hyphomicrobium sp.]RUP07936.1 MAG: glutamate-5-semialdehyde dehydrogenase [Hyphomicrobium sp.]
MNRPERIENDTAALMRGIGEAAKAASRRLAIATPEEKNNALKAAAKALRAAAPKILEANVKDVEAAKAAGRPASFVDRLLLDEKRVAGIAKGLEEIAELPDPIGTVLAEWTRPNGLKFQRVRVPLGTIGIIYESRPNVTADAGALSLKAGNASILRGGSESHHSSVAIHACLVEGLRAAGLPEAAIQLVPTTDREAVGAMLRGLDGAVDVIVPRGGKSLVQRVQEEARVPVFAHLEGICHTYVDKAANIDMALAIVVNAKMRRTGVCGATECLLIDKNAKSDFVTLLVQALLDEGCEVRGDAFVQKADPRVKAATAEDYGKEFLEPIIAVKMVDGVDEAIDHIARYGSQHTDAIITDSTTTGERFLDRVDSAIVLVNASTQFADGGEFGFGGEIGIATGKMHARGPVGVEQLTSFKYKVRGNGQIRPK